MKIIIAIISITTLEAIALFQGINGAILSVAVAAIAGLAGYELHRFRKRD